MSSDVGGEPHQHQPPSGVCKGCVKGACLGVFGGVSGTGLGCIWGVLPGIKVCHYMSSVCVGCYVCRW